LLNKTYWGPIIITQLEKFKEHPSEALLVKNKQKIVLKNKPVLEDTTIKKLDSFTLRKNLVLNGITYFKKSPLMGIGPGQFRFKLSRNQSFYPIDKNSSPHNYLIEMISQYGVLGGIIFLIPITLFVSKIIKRKWSFLYAMLVFLYYLEGVMPSSFLYLDINWILFSSIILCFSEDFIKFKSFSRVSVS
jgi:O-antigen ligase